MSAIIERVRKLLAMAESTDSVAEAAVAAARAAELMAQHELSEAEIRAAAGAEAAPPEPIVRDAIIPGQEKAKRRVAWKQTIASAAARAFHCHLWFRQAEFRLLGRTSNTQAASYVITHLWCEVDTLTEAAWRAAVAAGRVRTDRLSAKTWRANFRLGAAARLAERLYEQRRATVAPKAPTPGVEVGPPPASTMALAIVDRDREEVVEEWKTMTRRWRSSRSLSGTRTRVRDAYHQGREAGGAISLSGVGRQRLNRGQDSLP
jgi:hypothetical protein